MITPEQGRIYRVRHHGNVIRALCLEVIKHDGWKSPHSAYRRSACTRYHFKNLETSREIILKSRVKILALEG